MPLLLLRRKATRTIFNVSQVDGYTPPGDDLPDMPPLERHTRANAFIAATGADIRYGGDMAFYRPSTDHIQMPDPSRFRNPDPIQRMEEVLSVTCHELTHWTSPKHRCDRQLGKHFADDLYAGEELVAELGAAFLCAELGISPHPRPDHAAYIEHWLKVLKADNRAIFSAAARASEAVRYLHRIVGELQ
jgi:antirestriction protein ArdC